MNILANLKKGFAALTLSVMVAAIIPAGMVSGQFGFTDDAQIPGWADNAVEGLMDMGVITGEGDGSFSPQAALNRAVVSKMIVLTTGVEIDTDGGSPFSDVSEDAWYYPYVVTMYNMGWIDGYPDGTFQAANLINRAEIAKMAVESFMIDYNTTGAPNFSDVDESAWFFDYVETAYNEGLMTGYSDGTFGPANTVTKAETAVILWNAYVLTDVSTEMSEGTLEVELSMDTPLGTNIPYNATSVPFTTIELTASDDSDVEISSLTLTRLGLGDNDDFDSVWLEIDGFKVGNDKSVNNDDVVELRFNPPIIVPAGQTLVADVVASSKYSLAADGTCFDSGADGCNIGHHNRFALVSMADIASTAANVVGNFPIEGEEMEVASYAVSEVSFSPLGSDTTVDVGDNFIEVGKFRVQNESDTNKDVEVRAITFKNDGTATLIDVLENVALYVSGEQVSAETIIDGDYITFRLDNGVTGGYVIEDGDSKIFSMRADIVSAEKGDYLNFKVDNFEDIVAVEIGTSFGVKAIAGETYGLTLGSTTSGSDTIYTTTNSAGACENNANAEDACARLRAYTIDTGDINVSRDPASLGNQEYAPGSNDVVFLTARVIVDQPVILDGLVIRTNVGTSIADNDGNGTVNVTDLNNAFDNFRLYLGDSLIDSENDFAGTLASDGTGAYLDFNTSFEIAGTSVLKLVGNIENDANDGDEVKVFLDADDFDSPEYISTGDQISTNELLGSAEGSFVTVQDSSIVITKTDGYSVTGSATETIVAGVNDVTFMKFILDNNDSGDVSITSITVDALATGEADDYQQYVAAIFVDGTQQGSSKNLGSNGEATFNDINVVIPSAGQKEFTLAVNTSESLASGTALATTVVAGSLSKNTVAAVANVTTAGAGTAEFADVNAGSKEITLTTTASVTGIPGASGTANVSLSAGDQIVLSSDGNLDTDFARIRTVESAVTAGTSTTIVVTESIPQTYLGAEISVVTVQYPIGATGVTLASCSGLEDGDTITIAGTDYVVEGDVSTSTCNVVFDATAANPTLVAAAPIGTDVTQTNASSSVRFVVKAVEADNIENGADVEVKEGGIILGDGNTDTATLAYSNGNCTSTASDDNYLCGALFSMVSTGSLRVQATSSTPTDDIIIRNTENFEVADVTLVANYDGVEITDLYFKNDAAYGTTFEDRGKFSLVDETGSVLAVEQVMTGGALHFDLGKNNPIVVPKDDEITVTVRFSAGDISQNTVSQAGGRLKLSLDSAKGTSDGVIAVTEATGTNLEATAISSTFVESSDFVAMRSELLINHASGYTAAPAGDIEQGFYQFVLSADGGKVEVSRVGFDINLRDIAAGATFVPANFTVEKVGTSNNEDVPVTVTLDGNETDTYARAIFDFTTIQSIPEGESVTYQLNFINADLTPGTADPDSQGVRVDILEDDTFFGPDTIANVQSSNANAWEPYVIWSDYSGSGDNDFFNGYLIDVDTDPVTIRDN